MSGETISLARVLSKLGYCSRARAALYIKSGKVSVNGKLVRNPSIRIDIDIDVVEVDKKCLVKPKTVVVMLHKPGGYVTTSSDELSRKTVYELVPKDLHVFAVGRLDMDTSGLLLFTNNGQLQDRITSPDKETTKTYIATVSGKVTLDHIDKFLKGVEIGDGTVVKADQCRILSMELSRTIIQLKIHEGKNRQVKRMFETIGRTVTHLHRSAIGRLELDLPEGSWRKLTEDEIELIFS
ncbi:MAG: rRNA pseudouridine synthase [Bacteroidetes bacterium]|nr:rRNA pseudouridine synthase [Bacteroidota bacterium]